MSFPQVTTQEWRAQVEKELAGAPFDKALVHKTAEGISVQPLYTERPAGEPIGVDARGRSFRVCVKVAAEADAAIVTDEVGGGADALWLAAGVSDAALAKVDFARTFVVVEPGAESPVAVLERFAARTKDAPFAIAADPLGALARGDIEPGALGEAFVALSNAARLADMRCPHATVAVVSTLPYHDAGADAADEIAFALSTGVRTLDVLIGGGLTQEAAARQIVLRAAAGRDTFGEMCKLRALRITWSKVLAAVGAEKCARPIVHAVCSSRTLAQRDPWVNMLRVTSQVFAAALGTADLITPAAFDEALGPASALGRRVARNTGLVLREESALGKVKDPAGGSYYFDTLTDALAREAWKRFQAIEKDGGIESAIVSGQLRDRLDASWADRLDQVRKRKAAILGVSEFANVSEKLPRPARKEDARRASAIALPAHRDAEPFEDLRLRADAIASKADAILVTLGPLAESRPRVSFASNFFGAGGIRVRETTTDEAATIACICGSDERYASEAVARVRALKAAGCRRVLLAGRPGPLEPALREAGIDGFLFVGCDAAALLSELLEAFQ